MKHTAPDELPEHARDDDDAIDQASFRHVLGHHAAGVCIVTAIDAAGSPVGMTVNSFASASLAPPLVVFFASCKSRTWASVRSSGRFCVNVLAADQGWLCQRFAQPHGAKYEGVDHHMSALGPPILQGAIAWIECTLHSAADAGDHLVVLGRVRALAAQHGAKPLLTFRGKLGEFVDTSPKEGAS